MPTFEYRQTVRTSDRARLAVQVRGAGPALLLLPGQANNHHWWDYVRPDFARDCSTVTFDYRGTGDTVAPDEPYTTVQFAEDAVRVLDALAIDRFDVYGTSMGGRVAQWVAFLAGRRVRNLVLGCTTPGGEHAVERSPEVRRSLAADPGDEALAGLMYNPDWRRAHPGPYGTLGDPSMTTQARARHLAASNTHDAWDALPRISAPTLILHGTDDALAPVGNADLLASRIPDATVHLFTGVRHAYFDECRYEASALVLEWLRRHSKW